MRSRAALLAAFLASSLAFTAAAQMREPHGYVEPCTVAIVQDGNTRCEECSPSHDNPELCDETLGARGYERKCHTGVHSAPGEVWCIAKDAGGVTGRSRLMLMFLAVTLPLGLFLVLKRRKRARP